MLAVQLIELSVQSCLKTVVRAMCACSFMKQCQVNIKAAGTPTIIKRLHAAQFLLGCSDAHQHGLLRSSQLFNGAHELTAL